MSDPANNANAADAATAGQKPVTAPSTSDQRTVNNVMRHEYKVLSDAEKTAMLWVKDKGREMHEYLTNLGVSREIAVAKTKIEEAVMWAVKHITG